MDFLQVTLIQWQVPSAPKIALGLWQNLLSCTSQRENLSSVLCPTTTKKKYYGGKVTGKERRMITPNTSSWEWV